MAAKALVVITNAIDGSTLGRFQVELATTIAEIKKMYGAPDGSRLLSEETVILDDDYSFESRRIDETIMLKQVVDSALAKQLLHNGCDVVELVHTCYSFQPGPMSSSCGSTSNFYKASTDTCTLSLSQEDGKALVSEAERKSWKVESTSKWQGPDDQYTYHTWKPE